MTKDDPSGSNSREGNLILLARMPAYISTIATLKKDVATLRLAIATMAGAIIDFKSNETVVAVEVRSKVYYGFETVMDSLCSGHLAGAWSSVVSAENGDCI